MFDWAIPSIWNELRILRTVDDRIRALALNVNMWSQINDGHGQKLWDHQHYWEWVTLEMGGLPQRFHLWYGVLRTGLDEGGVSSGHACQYYPEGCREDEVRRRHIFYICIFFGEQSNSVWENPGDTFLQYQFYVIFEKFLSRNGAQRHH